MLILGDSRSSAYLTRTAEKNTADSRATASVPEPSVESKLPGGRVGSLIADRKRMFESQAIADKPIASMRQPALSRQPEPRPSEVPKAYGLVLRPEQSEIRMAIANTTLEATTINAAVKSKARPSLMVNVPKQDLGGFSNQNASPIHEKLRIYEQALKSPDASSLGRISPTKVSPTELISPIRVKDAAKVYVEELSKPKQPAISPSLIDDFAGAASEYLERRPSKVAALRESYAAASTSLKSPDQEISKQRLEQELAAIGKSGALRGTSETEQSPSKVKELVRRLSGSADDLLRGETSLRSHMDKELCSVPRKSNVGADGFEEQTRSTSKVESVRYLSKSAESELPPGEVSPTSKPSSRLDQATSPDVSLVFSPSKSALGPTCPSERPSSISAPLAKSPVRVDALPQSLSGILASESTKKSPVRSSELSSQSHRDTAPLPKSTFSNAETEKTILPKPPADSSSKSPVRVSEAPSIKSPNRIVQSASNGLDHSELKDMLKSSVRKEVAPEVV